MEILHLDLKTSENDDKATLWYFGNNPNIADLQFSSKTTISDLIEQIQKNYYEYLDWESPIINPEKTGQLLYNWLDSGDRLLARQIENRRDIILAISATERLAHLPWELLHDGTQFLVERFIIPIRWVKKADSKISIENSPQKRALKLLFMATEPENLGLPPLHYEQEEARILEANKLKLFLQVEESGCLEILKELVVSYGKELVDSYELGCFDVFHLTGHAMIEENIPYFITETEIGEKNKANVEEIAKAFQFNFPRLIFLSGCHSAQAAKEGATSSLAEALVKNGAKTVLGWGHRIPDTTATDAVAVFYRELNNGKTLAESLAISYKYLIENKINGWHLLRLYIGDTLPNALVTAPRGRKPPPPPSQITRLWGTNKVADRFSFVGRRRQIQHCIKALTQYSEKVGVVIYGFGGYGKSTLAARLCDRLTDFTPIMWEGYLDQQEFVRKLAGELSVEFSDLGTRLQNNEDNLDTRLRSIFRFLQDKSNQKFLFIFDNFEDNLELRNQEAKLKTKAIEVLESLIKAIQNEYSEHRIIITSRYDFPSFSLIKSLHREELNELRGADFKKKLDRLTAFKGDSEVDSNLQERAIELADGNARLLEWLDQILISEKLDRKNNIENQLNIAPILERLEELKQDNQDNEELWEKVLSEELREKVLAQVLTEQINHELKDILLQGLIFKIPVPREALEFVCQRIGHLDENIERAVGLGLLSVSPHEKLLRVPRILPISLPDNQETLLKQGAEILDKLWWNSNWTEEQAQEILRLALQGKNKKIVLKVGDKLTKKLNGNRRWIEVVSICQKIMEIAKSPQIFHNMAIAKQELGEVDIADEYYKKALNGIFTRTIEMQTEKADILRNLATFLANRDNRNLSQALDLLKQSLNITEEINDLYRQAWAKMEIGRYSLFQANEFKERYSAERQRLFQESESYLNQSKALFIQIGNRSGEAHSLHNLGMLKKSAGDNQIAIDFTEQALSINEEIEAIVITATNLHQLGKIYTDQQKLNEARQCFEKALKIKEEYRALGAIATTAYQFAKLEQRQGNILKSFELTLKALYYNQLVNAHDQKNNLNLVKELFNQWKDRNFPNDEEGCDKSARELRQQLLELSNNGRYQDDYEEAIALWGLGEIAVQEAET